MLFMAFYYRFAGLVACLALTANLLLILGLMVLFKAAFTLPGLAGLVLTIGMSVDANVLIFERIREERARGAAMRMAILNGFARATRTIVDANVTTLRTGFDLLFTPERDNRWFITFGGGWSNVNYDVGPDFDYPFASLGFGQRIAMVGRWRLRWELRSDSSLDDEGPFREKITRSFALIGFSRGPRVRPVDERDVIRDTDGDGVDDGRDRCPGTPRATPVDDHGCTLDQDRDGVDDGRDRCPDTPLRWPVDGEGCPTDGDADSVADGVDAQGSENPISIERFETGGPVAAAPKPELLAIEEHDSQRMVKR